MTFNNADIEKRISLRFNTFRNSSAREIQQIQALSINEAEVLFEKAFSVPAYNYTENEIRTI